MDFIYLGPSVADYRKSLECYIFFKDEIVLENKEKIEALILYPLSQNFFWGRQFLRCATDDLFSYNCRISYGNVIKKILAIWGNFCRLDTLRNPNGIIEFHQILDSRLELINKIQPILFFYKPASDLYESTDSNIKERYFADYQENLNKFQNEIPEILIQYFQGKEIGSEEKKITAWLVDEIFSLLHDSINDSNQDKIENLLKLAIGYDSYVDEYLRKDLERIKNDAIN